MINLNLELVVKAVIESRVAHPYPHQIHFISVGESLNNSERYGWLHIAFDVENQWTEPLLKRINETCQSLYGKPIEIYVYVRRGTKTEPEELK